MNKEIFETIQELRVDGKRWAEIFKKYNLNFKTINGLRKEFARELFRRRS